MCGIFDMRRKQWTDEECNRSCRRRMCNDIGACVWIVVVMYMITLLMLFITACITFFCGKDAWFAKGGVVATYMAANLSLPGSMVRDYAWYGKEWLERLYSISHNYSDYCPIFYLGKHFSQILKKSLHITGAVL